MSSKKTDPYSWMSEYDKESFIGKNSNEETKKTLDKMEAKRETFINGRNFVFAFVIGTIFLRLFKLWKF